MAFENSAATSPTDLLQKLNTFLVANGWTSDMSAADALGWRSHLHKGSQYVHLRATMNEFAPFKDNQGANGYSIAIYTGTGFNSGNAWNDQTTGAPVEAADATKPVGAGMRVPSTGVPNYYFFTDATNAHVVVVAECISGIFTCMGWGSSLAKVGAWTGGDYFFGNLAGFSLNNSFAPNSVAGDGATATCLCPGVSSDAQTHSCCFVRADVDSFTGKWISITDNTAVGDGYTGKNGASPIMGGPDSTGSSVPIHHQFPSYTQGYAYDPGAFQYNQVSLLDGRANLLPCLLYVQRDGSGGPGYSPLGTIPTCFCTSAVGQGFAPAEDYPIGADTYTTFPGFAVKKVV